MLSVKGVLGPKRGGGGIWRTYPVTFYFKQVSRANSSVQGETRAKFHPGWGWVGGGSWLISRDLRRSKI